MTDLATNDGNAPRFGSDLVAYALREQGFPYISLNPGASFRALHDSMVNFLGNETPEIITCMHEEHAIGIAQGYAKITDTAMPVAVHSNVGLMHATMGIFNAWCDRTPMLVIGATGPLDAVKRRPWIEWIHKVINRISDISLPENAGDFKLISRRVVAELIKLNEYQPYTRGLIPWVGFRQETIEYKRNSRFAGETKFPLFQSRGPLNEFVKGITSFSEIPLYLSLFIGFSVSALSFLYLIVVLFKKLNGWSLPGWTAIMGVTLLLGGIILFTNGVIGIYIGRIYNNVKGRPAYIIDDTIGFEESPPDDNGRQQS